MPTNKTVKELKRQVSNNTNDKKVSSLEEEIETQLKKQSDYKKSVTAIPKKKKTTFQKVTIVAAIIMVLLMVGPIIYTSFHSAGLF